MANTLLARPSSDEILHRLEIQAVNEGACANKLISCSGNELVSINPSDESILGSVRCAKAAEYEQVLSSAAEVYQRWRMYPAPKRGQIVRAIGDELRKHKNDLGALVTLETGKIRA